MLGLSILVDLYFWGRRCAGAVAAGMQQGCLEVAVAAAAG